MRQAVTPAGVVRRFIEVNPGGIEPVQNYVFEAQAAEAPQRGSATREESVVRSTDQPLVAVVTGGSRGAGKGIALALAAAGATVYVTRRSQQEGDADLPGTIWATAAEIDKAGGKGIAVPCDHRYDSQVSTVFERVSQEQGRLDILVNNATFLHDELTVRAGFWQKSPEGIHRKNHPRALPRSTTEGKDRQGIDRRGNRPGVRHSG